MCAFGKIEINNTEGDSIVVSDLRLIDSDTFSFKLLKTGSKHTYKLDRLDPESRDQIMIAFHKSSPFSLKVSTIKNSRIPGPQKIEKHKKSKKPIKVLGSGSIARYFEATFSTHLEAEFYVDVEIYCMQGKDVLNVKQIERLSVPIVRGQHNKINFSDRAEYSWVRNLRTGEKTVKGGESLDFYLVATNPISGQIETWTTSDFMAQKFEAGVVQLQQNKKDGSS